MAGRATTTLAVCRLLPALLGLFVVAIAVPSAAQQVVVRPEATHLYADQVVNVDVYVGGVTEIADVAPSAGEDFEIVAAEVNPIRDEHRTAIVDGTARRVHDLVYRFTARPLRSGTLSLPVFEVRIGEQVRKTQPITIAVATETTESLLICEVKSPFDSAYVGQPIELTLQVWIRVDQLPDFVNNLGRFLWDTQFREEAATKLGVFSGVDLTHVRYRQNVARQPNSSHRYHLFELRKTVYPSVPGVLDWGEIAFAYNYPTQLSRDPFGGLRIGESPLRLRRSPVLPEVRIEPLPMQGRPESFRGAIGEYEIAVVATPLEVILGDPIELTIEVSGRGLERLRPPDLTLNEALARDFEIVPDDPAGEIFGSQKLFKRTIRPKRLDVERVPPLAMNFFNPLTRAYETVHSEPISILVNPRPAANDSGDGDASTRTRSEDRLQLLPIETDAGLILLPESSGVRWEIWLSLLPMPMVCACVSWRRRSRAMAATRRSQCRRRAALAVVMELAAKGEQSDVREITLAILEYVAACTDRLLVSDRRQAAEALAEFGISGKVVDSVDKMLARLDEAAYSGEEAEPRIVATIAHEAESTVVAIESEVRG